MVSLLQALASSLPVLVILILVLQLYGLQLLVILVPAFIQLVRLHASALHCADITNLPVVQLDDVLQVASLLARNVAKAELELVEALQLEPSSFFAF